MARTEMVPQVLPPLYIPVLIATDGYYHIDSVRSKEPTAGCDTEIHGERRSRENAAHWGWKPCPNCFSTVDFAHPTQRSGSLLLPPPSGAV